jgi:pimeloyl-ACP methyl ester carboxylesterase
MRLAPELVAARPSWPARVKLALEHGSRLLKAPVSPGRMAAYVRAWHQTDLVADCRRITAPTLLVTGERGLDRVVPVDRTLEYQQLIRHARHVEIPRTGHIGLVTQPRQFAAEIDRFLDTEGGGATTERTRHAS